MNNLQEVREKNKATCASTKKSLVCPDLNLVLQKLKMREQADTFPDGSLLMTKKKKKKSRLITKKKNRSPINNNNILACLINMSDKLFVIIIPIASITLKLQTLNMD